MVVVDSSKRLRDHLVVYHLAPVMTDFISDENWECCNNELEQTLTLLQGEWSKEIEPSRQSSTHHPLIDSNPIDEKGSDFMGRSMRWEAPSTPTTTYDPRLFCDQETPLKTIKDWFLDLKIPAGGFVRISEQAQYGNLKQERTKG